MKTYNLVIVRCVLKYVMMQIVDMLVIETEYCVYHMWCITICLYFRCNEEQDVQHECKILTCNILLCYAGTGYTELVSI